MNARLSLSWNKGTGFYSKNVSSMKIYGLLKFKFATSFSVVCSLKVNIEPLGLCLGGCNVGVRACYKTGWNFCFVEAGAFFLDLLALLTFFSGFSTALLSLSSLTYRSISELLK